MYNLKHIIGAYILIFREHTNMLGKRLHLFVLQLIGLMLIIINIAYGQPEDEPVYFSLYPIQASVSYGADNKLIELKFKIVNNDQIDPNSEKSLSGFALTTSSGLSLPIKIRADKSCPKVVLPAQSQKGSCKFHVQFRESGNQPESISNKLNETLTLSLQYTSNGKTYTLSSPPFPLVYATGAHIPSLARTVNIKNNCAHPVWLGVAPYGAKVKNPDHDTIPSDHYRCESTQDCYPGSTCVVVRKEGQNGAHDPGLKRCFWNAQSPTADQYRLEPHLGSTTLSIPYYDNGVETFWEGAIAARTECENGSCKTAECGTNRRGKSGVGCESGKTFSLPASFAKLTFQGSNSVIYNTTPNGNGAKDIYTVSIAHGVHIPLMIEPLSSRSGAHEPYECGIAGARNNTYPLGHCSWDFSPLNNDYRWVSFLGNAANSCESDRDCIQPNHCGLSFNPVAKSGKQITKTCGEPLGYWTPHALCLTDPNFKSAKVDCRYATHDGNKVSDLFACSKNELKRSCYKDNAKDSCCGCVNWESVTGINVPTAPLTKKCENINPNWTLHAQPKLIGLKAACPTASVYPHDAASSAFSCQKLDLNQMNTSNYTITFCP